MKILIIEPYFTGSHASWAEGLIEYSKHEISCLNIPGKYWKWRMHGGSVTLAREFLSSGIKPDLIIATDMLDLTSFLSLTRKETSSIPVIIYFHENQLTYPWSPEDRDVLNKRDKHYAFINYSSALAADAVLFNSRFHYDSFTNALYGFLKSFPDYNETLSIETIKKKSSVMPLGIGLEKFDIYKHFSSNIIENLPLILWNHRWEYDKNPEDFFNALYKISKKGIDFSVAILGERFGKIPEEFVKAEKKLGSKIVKFGYADSFEDYAKWLWKSDIIPITSNQEFFGISLMEALFCQTIPVLPKRLTYPELVPIKRYNDFFYDGDDCSDVLEKILLDLHSVKRTPFRKIASKYDWENMIGKYDQFFENITSSI